MHEAGLALEIADLVTRRAGGARVRKVVLEIGALAAVLPEALSFCFECAVAGTPLEGAELDIERRPARARCAACGATLELERPFGRCACGGDRLDWLSGDELRVRAIEVQ
jgi:hydrogenase nickel incorporation protein HypA/HybF